MDWEKCTLCQEEDINLLDPFQNKNLEVDGYSKLAANIDSFLNKDFLRCSENKKTVVVTIDENVICSQSLNLEDITPCNIEEADERMLLHVNHAAKQFSKHLIKTVDSDVIIISQFLTSGKV